MVTASLDVAGGMQKLVLRLAEQLEADGHRVRVHTTAVDRERCYPDLLRKVDVCECHTVAGRRSPLWSSIRRRLPGDLRRVADFDAVARCIGRGPDALIIHDWQSLLAVSRFKEPNPQAPVIWMLNQQVKGAMFTQAYWAKRYAAGASWTRYVRKPLAALVAARFVSALNDGLGQVDVVATYDSFNRDRIGEELNKEAHVVYAGADVARVAALAEKREPQRRRFNVLSVGILFSYRRYEDLIHAVADLVRLDGLPVFVTIVGSSEFEPEYRRRLIDIAAELGVSERVRLIGVVDDVQLCQLYTAAEAFVFANDGHTWGIAVFEAMAAGIPVVVSENVGCAEMLTNGRHASIVPPRDPSAIAAALRMISRDPRSAQEWVARAQKEVLPLVSWSAYANRMLAVIASVQERMTVP